MERRYNVQKADPALRDRLSHAVCRMARGKKYRLTTMPTRCNVRADVGASYIARDVGCVIQPLQTVSSELFEIADQEMNWQHQATKPILAIDSLSFAS